MCKEASILHKLKALCSRHGYIHSSVDLRSSGVKGCYDYGPLGALLRRNIQNEWWKSVVTSQEAMFGCENAQLHELNSANNSNSDGLLAGSVDQHTATSTHASSHDQLNEPSSMHSQHKESDNDKFDSRNETDRRTKWILRDSLRQGILAHYHYTLQLVNRRLPFGLAQIGRCFRETSQSDERASCGNSDRYLFDLPEFSQMMAQFYCSPKMADRWMIDWQRDRLQWWRKRDYSQKSPIGRESCGNLRFPLQTGLRLDPRYAECNNVSPVTMEDVIALEAATVGQTNCSQWFHTREKRLTSSVFGRVLRRKKAVNDKFLMSLFGGSSNSDSSPAMVYGKNHEQEAKSVFAAKNPHLHVHDCGFVVNPKFSFLGASPDGKVCDDGQTGILEIKCPYSARGLSVAEAVESLPQFYMLKCGSVEGALTLKRNHEYYYQVQGQLMVTGAPFCDFVVFTDKDVYVERILPNTQLWETMLHKLADFYLTHAMPFLQDQI